MALDLKGKTALVTGAGSGICLEFAKKLLAGGCNVVIADLALQPQAEEVVSAAKEPRAIFVKTDVTKWDQLQVPFDKAISEFGRLDIVVPGAGIFDPPSSNFWNINKGTDTIESSSYLTFDLNITHPVRATQLAIDSFMRQKLGHGVVVNISSIAAQMPLLPIPLYSASKHAISGFTRCLAHLETTVNIRVNAVAPGIVKTPIWTPDKLSWVDEDKDTWVTADRVAETMIDLITKPEHVGGTVLEVGVDAIRPVGTLNDPGPNGRGHTVENAPSAYGHVYEMLNENFGK